MECVQDKVITVSGIAGVSVAQGREAVRRTTDSCINRQRDKQSNRMKGRNTRKHFDRQNTIANRNVAGITDG